MLIKFRSYSKPLLLTKKPSLLLQLAQAASHALHKVLSFSCSLLNALTSILVKSSIDEKSIAQLSTLAVAELINCCSTLIEVASFMFAGKCGTLVSVINLISGLITILTLHNK